MSDVTTAVRRQFKYNGQVIISPEQDPGPEFSAREILEHLKTTGIFPELAKSEIEIKETNLADGTVQFEFVKKAGTKGAVYQVDGSYRLRHFCSCPYCDRMYENGVRTISLRLKCDPGKLNEELQRIVNDGPEGNGYDADDVRWLSGPEAKEIFEDQLLREMGAPELPGLGVAR